MLFTTYKNFPYSVDYYSYTTVTSADGTVTERRYTSIPTSIRVSISTTYIGDLVIISKTKMQKGGLLKNLTDRNNAALYQGGEWQISQTMPIANTVGTVEGYKYKAKLIAGDI